MSSRGEDGFHLKALIDHPMVARLVHDPFDRDGWLFELKWDGYRAIAETDGQGATRLYSRNHNDFKKRFPPIAQARETMVEAESIVETETLPSLAQKPRRGR
jgi:bifunctional non-homologous end joining protein LigD